MSITSFYFLCLFALALVLYYVIPKKAQWAFLLLLSLGYFMTSDTVVQSGGWYVVFYLLAAVAAVWGAAIYIDRTAEPKKKRGVLVCAVLFCLGLLCVLRFFKLPLLAPLGFPFIPLPCWDICSTCIMRSGKSRKTTSASFCSEAISL